MCYIESVCLSVTIFLMIVPYLMKVQCKEEDVEKNGYRQTDRLKCNTFRSYT